MAEFELGAIVPEDWSEVSALIYDSINCWYRNHGFPEISQGPKDVCRLFCEVYEQIDPGRCLVAVETVTGKIAGSCFYHPQRTTSCWVS